MIVGGRPLVSSAKYRAATVDFIAKGGSGYAMLSNKRFKTTGKICRDVFIEQMKNE